jgi:hypothetical protein
MRDYPHLGQLIGAHFHEDYEGETVEGAVHDFSLGGAADVRAALSEVDQILAKNLDEQATEILLERHGCCIRPPHGDASYTEFLLHIRGALVAVASG